MMKKLMTGAILAVCAHSAHAATATGTLNVQATVVNTCSVSTAPVVFSNVGLTQVAANGSITVNCTNTGTFDVQLDGGLNGTVTNRALKHTSSTKSFNYQLYTDPGFTTVWGDTTAGTVPVGTGPSQTLTVYGRTITTPDTAGTYSDEVEVTVVY